MGYSDEELEAFAQWERQAWETRAARYADGITALTKGAADALLDAAEVTAGARVLDVATGPGVVALAARDRGADVIAVDQSERMVALARGAGLDAREAGVDQLPFEDGAFQAVIAGFLLNHLARPEKGVAEMARVCRGRVALTVWDVPAANPALGLFGSVVPPSGGTDVVPRGPESDLYAEDTRLTALLRGAGLDHVRVGRVSWTLTVDPARWFDDVAAGTPRTGATLAAASPAQLVTLRERYVEVARKSYGRPDGSVVLPATAVVAAGRSA